MTARLSPSCPRACSTHVLLAGLLLLPLGATPGHTQDSSASPPVAVAGDAAAPSSADVIRQCERLLAAADAGDRAASEQFGEFYKAVYVRAFYEASFDAAEKYATPIAPQISVWLLQRATAGSAAAQYWMAARDKFMRGYGGTDADLAEIARWYRLSAEQGFPPAEFALGQLLIFFDEFAQEPDEAELWLYRAALHEQERADVFLLNRLRNRAVDGHMPRDEIATWLEARAAAGDGEAQGLLDLIRKKSEGQ